MKYFAVFLPMLDVQKSTDYRQDHLNFLGKLKEEGKIFAFGRFVDGAGGLIIYRADTLEAAKSMAEQDPYVVHKARGFEIHEWDVNL